MRRSRYLLFLSVLLLVACSSGTTDDASSEADQAETTSAPQTTATEAEGSTEPEPEEATTTAAVQETASTTIVDVVGDVPCGLVVEVVFDEGAPRDRMSIANESTTEISIDSFRIDLSSSVGGIIFDTLEGGSGVEVFQDFQVEGGDAVLSSEPVAEDGADELRLEYDTFNTGESFEFSIDVDDQLPDSDLGQIQVTGAEIAGALVAVTTADGSEVAGVFDDSSSARVQTDC